MRDTPSVRIRIHGPSLSHVILWSQGPMTLGLETMVVYE